MKIIGYNNCLDIIVEFQDEYHYQTHTTMHYFKIGMVYNPYYPQIFNKGIKGAKYSSLDGNGKATKEYLTWYGMMRRCYNVKEQQKPRNSTYIKCAVCDSWLLYENFYDWMHKEENFKTWINLRKASLDKDILIKHNNIYSPERCSLVPSYINNLFTRREADRGSCVIGVSYHKRDKKYYANCADGTGKLVFLGSYTSEYEAFIQYKKYKENLIKEVANKEYNAGAISSKCYEAMMKYEVEITD